MRFFHSWDTAVSNRVPQEKLAQIIWKLSTTIIRTFTIYIIYIFYIYIYISLYIYTGGPVKKTSWFLAQNFLLASDKNKF